MPGHRQQVALSEALPGVQQVGSVGVILPCGLKDTPLWRLQHLLNRYYIGEVSTQAVHVLNFGETEIWTEEVFSIAYGYCTEKVLVCNTTCSIVTRAEQVLHCNAS